MSPYREALANVGPRAPLRLRPEDGPPESKGDPSGQGARITAAGLAVALRALTLAGRVVVQVDSSGDFALRLIDDDR